MDPVSNKIADNLIALFNAGLNSSNFQIVGFSLGSQFAGHVGRKINSKSSGKYTLQRLVGLEPAIGAVNKLGASDAAFVMTVHTGTVFSDDEIIGHVAFYPNGGINQPMCSRRIFLFVYEDATCSHSKLET
jgi:Lipase